MTYEFLKAYLSLVTSHAEALDIEIWSLSLSGDLYTMVTAQPFPPEQLEHLGLTEVA